MSEVTVGPLLRALRVRSGRSQAQQAVVLSELAGRPVSRHEISRWENEARLPTAYWQWYLGASLGMDVADLNAAVLAARSRRRVALGMIDPRYLMSPDVADIEVMREMVATFRRLDNRLGGGHVRQILEGYVIGRIEALIPHVGEKLRCQFFIPAAELYHLAGWIAYDMADVQAGRRMLQAALRLCQDVASESLIAEILCGMSHQAAFQRSPDAAVELGIAAGHAASRARSPMLQAEAAVMEAHGLALQSDRTRCLSALSQAERYFDCADQTDTPPWLAYFDEAYLAAKFGHVLRELNRPHEAEKFARRSLAMRDGYERGRMFNMALLASVLADQAKVDESVKYAEIALDMSYSLQSARSRIYLRDVFNRLQPYRSEGSVKNLQEKLESAAILRPAG